MAIDLISKIKPKNNGNFAMVDAVDVELPDGSRLDAYVETQKSSVESLQANDRAFSEQVAALAAKDASISKDIEALKNKDSDVGDSIAVLIAKDLAIDNQISDLADADQELANRTKALEDRFADMDYGDGIVFTSFSHNRTGTYEIGEKITDLTLSWGFDREPTTQNLTGPTLDSSGVSPDISGKSYSYLISGVDITADNQAAFRWKITATDNREKTISRNSPGFTFLNGVYYGAAEVPEVIDSAFVRSLTRKLSSGKVTSFTVNAKDGEYIWYCLPVRPPFGACTFVFGANEVTFELVDDAFEFENASGYVEPYYIYRSANAGLGDTTMGVK